MFGVKKTEEVKTESVTENPFSWVLILSVEGKGPRVQKKLSETNLFIMFCFSVSVTKKERVKWRMWKLSYFFIFHIFYFFNDLFIYVSKLCLQSETWKLCIVWISFNCGMWYAVGLDLIFILCINSKFLRLILFWLKKSCRHMCKLKFLYKIKETIIS